MEGVELVAILLAGMVVGQGGAGAAGRGRHRARRVSRVDPVESLRGE